MKMKIDGFTKGARTLETCCALIHFGRFDVMAFTTSDEGSKGAIYFDVFLAGELEPGPDDESVASLRIDEDEGTVTFYDPGADEGHTVYEAGERCSACGRESLACSKDPCKDVIKDREATE